MAKCEDETTRRLFELLENCGIERYVMKGCEKVLTIDDPEKFKEFYRRLNPGVEPEKKTCPKNDFSIKDYGQCYGAVFDYKDWRIIGYDVLPEDLK